MASITNLTRKGMDFTVGSANGQPIVEHLKAGETRDIAVDLSSAQVKGRLAACVILVDGKNAAPREPARIPAPSPALLERAGASSGPRVGRRPRQS